MNQTKQASNTKNHQPTDHIACPSHPQKENTALNTIPRPHHFLYLNNIIQTQYPLMPKVLTYAFAKIMGYLNIPPLAPTYATIKPETAHVFAEAVVGLQHRQPKIQLPCQDAVQATLKPRAILILCDGAGSASVSDIGANALVLQLVRFSQTLEPLLKTTLDVAATPDTKLLVRLYIRHAIGILQDCAHTHRRSIKDFRSTLNLVIVGTQHSLWIKIGDGEIIQENIYQSYDQASIQTQYQCLGGHHKGEFANQTQFIDDQLTLDDVQYGLLDSQTTTGLALMSDGAAEKLVSTVQKNQVASQVSQWLQQLRSDQFKVKEFYRRIYSDDFLNRSTGDDRAIALYSCQYTI